MRTAGKGSFLAGGFAPTGGGDGFGLSAMRLMTPSGATDALRTGASSSMRLKVYARCHKEDRSKPTNNRSNPSNFLPSGVASAKFFRSSWKRNGLKRMSPTVGVTFSVLGISSRSVLRSTLGAITKPAKAYRPITTATPSTMRALVVRKSRSTKSPLGAAVVESLPYPCDISKKTAQRSQRPMRGSALAPNSSSAATWSNFTKKDTPRWARLSSRIEVLLESRPVPMRCVGGGLIGTLQKRQERRLWIQGVSNLVVRKQELTERFAEERTLRRHRRILESIRRRVRIRVKGCIVDPTPTRPESRTAQLMGIRLHHDGGREPGNLAREGRSGAAGEAGDRQIETAPKKMHGACLTDESRAEFLEHAICLQEGAPESMRRVSIVGRMFAVGAEWDRAGNFTGQLGYPHLDAEIAERLHDGRMEIADRVRHQPEAPALSAACLDVEHMVDEVEPDLEVFTLVRDHGRRQAARGNVERHMPAVVEPRGQPKPNLADDLDPKAQGLAGRLPGQIGKRGPDCILGH